MTPRIGFTEEKCKLLFTDCVRSWVSSLFIVCSKASCMPLSTIRGVKEFNLCYTYRILNNVFCSIAPPSLRSAGPRAHHCADGRQQRQKPRYARPDDDHLHISLREKEILLMLRTTVERFATCSTLSYNERRARRKTPHRVYWPQPPCVIEPPPRRSPSWGRTMAADGVQEQHKIMGERLFLVSTTIINPHLICNNLLFYYVLILGPSNNFANN